MVGFNSESSQTQIVSAGVRKTIQSIKEIVGKNHSDADIYVVLRESNMDPNETAQKLLNQDPFHEVKRKRDKKKESLGMGNQGSFDPRKHSENAGQRMRHSENAGQGMRHTVVAGQGMRHSENAGQGMRHSEDAGQGTRHTVVAGQGTRHTVVAGQGTRHTVVAGQGMRHSDSAGQVIRNSENAGQGIRNSENAGQGMRYRTFPDRITRRRSYSRNALPDAGFSREFRIVRDNRVNGNMNRELRPASPQYSTSTKDQAVANVTEKSLIVTSGSQKTAIGRSPFQASNGPNDPQPRYVRDASSGGTARKEAVEEKRLTVLNAVSRAQAVKPNNSQTHPTMLASNSVVGVYSSSTDPVHVPSPDSRSSAAVGAIKREVGVVGVRRQSSENAMKSAPNSSVSNSLLVRDSSSESFRSFHPVSKSDQQGQATGTESALPSISVSKSFLSNQYGSRPHQQVVGHQKAPLPNKEWKPKSSQKSSAISPGVIGTPKKSSSPAADNSKDLESEADKLQDKLSRVDIYDSQNVIIAQHIRVPETDRCQLTFGSFGVEFDSSRNSVSGYQANGFSEESNGESAASLSASSPESSTDDASGSKQVDILNDHARNSGYESSVSGAASEQQLPDKKESPRPQTMENYADIGLLQANSPSYTPSDSQQQQDPPELPNFSAYDPQTGYDLPYFRPTMDETIRGQGLPSPQEALGSHTANSIPASTIAMVQQQQQPPMAQMYPQVHVSHFANLMPYRQFLSPVYVPQMAMPGYSSNPAYPHPSNGSSYLLMPGGSSHLGANGLKYGIQQFKPLPAGSPTGFGNFTSPAGYPINAPGVVGNAAGLEDSARMKYKDGNLYVPNPQAETSEIWIPNPRELPGMQSAPYYNMPGQAPHAAYLPSHSHASFNAAAAQSSHMQFPGLYHPPPQPAAMANPHHLASAMGGNVGVGVGPTAPGAQVGAYQQPQLGNLNWTTNF
ncbi:DUF1296 domain-containing protein [Cephalotus follicularis]|uniref:DUF1296 domain-containing protein n=1 Tax=Cephalotus follicularis TaxID=3775 RepID=A0A1Q3CXG7_CEPFO|nr:DUF1296 domain-containing protein [Cephalotus follicularis]